MSERDDGLAGDPGEPGEPGEPVNDLSWPVNDLHGLAQRLPEFDVHAYYDEQARRAYEGALLRCPVLARLLGLAGSDPSASAGSTTSEGG